MSHMLMTQEQLRSAASGINDRASKNLYAEIEKSFAAQMVRVSRELGPDGPAPIAGFEISPSGRCCYLRRHTPSAPSDELTINPHIMEALDEAGFTGKDLHDIYPSQCSACKMYDPLQFSVALRMVAGRTDGVVWLEHSQIMIHAISSKDVFNESKRDIMTALPAWTDGFRALVMAGGDDVGLDAALEPINVFDSRPLYDNKEMFGINGSDYSLYKKDLADYGALPPSGVLRLYMPIIVSMHGRAVPMRHATLLYMELHPDSTYDWAWYEPNDSSGVTVRVYNGIRLYIGQVLVPKLAQEMFPRHTKATLLPPFTSTSLQSVPFRGELSIDLKKAMLEGSADAQLSSMLDAERFDSSVSQWEDAERYEFGTEAYDTEKAMGLCTLYVLLVLCCSVLLDTDVQSVEKRVQDGIMDAWSFTGAPDKSPAAILRSGSWALATRFSRSVRANVLRLLDSHWDALKGTRKMAKMIICCSLKHKETGETRHVLLDGTIGAWGKDDKPVDRGEDLDLREYRAKNLRVPDSDQPRTMSGLVPVSVLHKKKGPRVAFTDLASLWTPEELKRIEMQRDAYCERNPDRCHRGRVKVPTDFLKRMRDRGLRFKDVPDKPTGM